VLQGLEKGEKLLADKVKSIVAEEDAGEE